MSNTEFAEIKNTLEKGARRSGNNPVDLWPHECVLLLAKLERLANLEQLLKHYKAEREYTAAELARLKNLTDPDRYDTEEL